MPSTNNIKPLLSSLQLHAASQRARNPALARATDIALAHLAALRKHVTRGDTLVAAASFGVVVCFALSGVGRSAQAGGMTGSLGNGVYCGAYSYGREGDRKSKRGEKETCRLSLPVLIFQTVEARPTDRSTVYPPLLQPEPQSAPIVSCVQCAVRAHKTCTKKQKTKIAIKIFVRRYVKCAARM